MGTIEIALLGPVQVRLDGTSVPLPSARQRVVLACLALDAGRPVSVSRLIDALWPADVPENAPGNLQSHVSRLRRTIGRDRLPHDPGGYRLAVETTDVDLGVARALVAEARALAPGAPATAASRIDDALRLWRGDPHGAARSGAVATTGGSDPNSAPGRRRRVRRRQHAADPEGEERRCESA